MSQSTLQPPQEQSRQPGLEHEMQPLPDFSPRFPGAGRLTGQVALVTGGDSGIGRAVAVAMAREGADIAVVYLNEHRDAGQTVDHVLAEGRRGLAIACDIADKAACHRCVEQAVGELGRLDILVNNAAEQHETAFEALSPEQLLRTFQTNVFGYFYMTQAALAHLPEGGVIVNSTSITAYEGYPTMVDYSATRGAVVSLTRSLAKLLVGRGIRVNAVAPGPIWTPLIPASFDADKVARHGSSAPMGRAGQPNEVASSYVFLASADASYMTGQVLHPNGGTLAGS